MSSQFGIVFFNVYQIYEGGDEWGNERPAEFYSTHTKATLAAKGRGAYGGNAKVETKYAVSFNGVVYVLADKNPIDLDGQLAQRTENIRKQALAKLTPEEVEALKIKLK